eukprot:CAMPEP_0181043914 /NCGR_PEP_ID=MMETSP1070-20121207/12971_1 /TAXON_ID=265543 /ORGANISM="Minutocellus polymorphus, Strain NH13" /LENGTH=192 /DNA_ID=CAMNT_0023122293 /DNA_START=422 /DNA_END=996 /DNA_ORIENTATION=-
MSSTQEMPTEKCGSASQSKMMPPASPGRRPLSRLQESGSGSGSPNRGGSSGSGGGSGRIQDDHNSANNRKPSSPGRRPVSASTTASVPVFSNHKRYADATQSYFAANDQQQRPPPPPPPPSPPPAHPAHFGGSPALPPEVPLSPVQQRQLSARNIFTKVAASSGIINGTSDQQQQMGSGSTSTGAGTEDAGG